MNRAHILLALSAATVAVLPAGSQDAACNNLTRTIQVTAGFHNQIEDTCQQITITVAGQSVSSPAKCSKGYALYGGSVYTCGPAATGIHCIAQGYKVDVTIASDGACPDTSGLSPGSWNSWKDVPAAIAKAMKCVPPKTKKTFDWSAQCVNCPTGKKKMQGAIGENHSAAGGESYLLWEGDPSGLLPVHPRNPFHSEYDRAQDGQVASLPEPLRTACLAYAPYEAAEIAAEVRIEHFAVGGALENRRLSRMRGKVGRDGRFDVIETVLADGEQPAEVLSQRVVFDGSSLFTIVDGAETSNAYGASYAGFDRTFAVQSLTVAPLHDWVSDPCEVSLFEGALFEVGGPDPQGRVEVSRLLIDELGAMFASEIWVIDASSVPAHPLEYRALDCAGGVREEILYVGRSTEAGNAWRPSTWTRTFFLDGEPEGRRAVVTVHLESAVELAPGGTVVSPLDDEKLWYVWN